MTTYTWAGPADGAFRPRQARWRQVPNVRATTSVLTGYTQTNGLPGSRWALSLDMPEQSWLDRRRLAAFLHRLEGKKHRVSMVCPVYPNPAGTINLSGVAVQSAAAQFAESLVLTGCGAGKTLQGFDWMVIAGQRLQVVADATANGSGVMTVEVRHSLRAAVSAGTAVTLSAPASLFILDSEPPPIPFDANARAPAFTIELIEAFTA